MLREIEDVAEKQRAQSMLLTSLKKMPSLGTQRVVFRPGSLEVELFGYGNGNLYFGTLEMENGQKYWNSFGLFEDSWPGQRITIEINVRLNEGRTEGFFAKDETGRVYLMHTGRPGGGKPGVSRENFLAWLKPELVAVFPEVGASRAGIVIGRLDASNLIDRIEYFVRQVRLFKDAVNAGELDNAAFKERASEWKEYRKEFSGRKTGAVSVDLDYVSFHGDVVEALKSWADGRLERGAKATNSPLIDLLVHRDGRLTDVFEVKTSGSRQVLYTAIGQLTVHSAGDPKVRRHLILPENAEVPTDVAQALRVGNVKVQRFRIRNGKTAVIVE